MDKGKVIYLDHHTSTHPCNLCIEKMKDFQEKRWTSQNSPYFDGTYDLESAYQMIYDFLGASYEDSFTFFSSWEEAVYQILFGIYFHRIRKEGKTHIIAFNIEKTPILQVLKKLDGVVLHLLEKNEEGTIDLNKLEELISPRTALVCFSWADGVSGVVHPIESVLEICKKHKIEIYVDATYLLGKTHLPLNDLPIDYLTFSGRALHGPHSSAGAFVKKDRDLPLLKNEIDIAALMGLSAACQQSLLCIDQMGLEVARLRNFFEKRLKSELKGVEVQYQNQARLSNVSSIRFDKVNSEALLFFLQKDQLFASLGKGTFSLSFSLSRYTTKEEIERGASLIIKHVKHLQTLSEDL